MPGPQAHDLNTRRGKDGEGMRRVLVVHHDIDLADQEADSLRRQGFEVEQCSGPTTFSCPVMRGEPCPAAHRADVLVYDIWASGEAGGAQRLIEGLREVHPEVPVVLTAPGIELDWVEIAGRHRVVPLVGTPTGARLADAIGQALDQAGDRQVAGGGPGSTA
jgi:DNA-binding NtrC family response regulator